MDNQALPRSVWQDFAAIQARTPRTCLPLDNGLGREIVYPDSLRTNLVEYIFCELNDFRQAAADIASVCPADFVTSSAALRYVLHECGKEQVFSLQQQVGKVLTLTLSKTKKPSQKIHLMIVRANQRAPLIADDFLLCLEKLKHWLGDRGASNIYFPKLDPERPVYSLGKLYQVMTDLFAGTNINVILHNRMYVSWPVTTHETTLALLAACTYAILA